MDKRYQVFVSSTFEDLREERQRVMQVVLERECFPAVMELFPAASEDQWSYVEKTIDDSDYYIVILAGKYGSVDENGISFTEREYDYAISQEIPVIAFYHRDLGKLPGDKLEIEPKVRKKLEAFHKKVKGNLCKGWESPEELALAVGNSLWKLVKDRPREGWVRAGEAGDPAVINKLNERIFELQREARRAETSAPAGTENLAGGADKIALSATIRYEKPTDKVNIAGNRISNEYEGQVEQRFSWDFLVSQLGPAMYDEATENALYRALESLLHSKLDWPENSKARRVSIRRELFYTVLSQFRALGLVEKSSKKHAPSDRNVYWQLTPYGQNYVVRLKAIKKAPAKKTKKKKDA